MKIQSLRIKNLRAFADETVLLDDYTCMVGANGAGKSTVLCALNIFFRETEGAASGLARLDAEDFHQKNTEEPIGVIVTFGDLTQEESAAFADYYRQGQLVVTTEARFDPATGQATIRQYGSRLAMAEFAHYFERAGDRAKADELKSIFAELRDKFPDMDRATSMADMAAALRRFEADRPEMCVLMPSDDEFYGVQGSGKLRKHVQWVYVPAVKDAASEQAEAKNTALGRLLARTVRAKVNFSEQLQALRAEAEVAYRKMLDGQQSALNEISATLQERLAEWSHPDATARLEWQQDQRSSVKIEEPLAHLLAGDGEFEGQIGRFGHGLQRSYILALLHGLAAFDAEDAPRLILGIEEPELYQHPPQARHLAQVLEELTQRNSQVIVTTHSPLFVGGEGFESVRMARKNRATKRSHIYQIRLSELGTRVAQITGSPAVSREGVMAKLHQVLQPSLSEMFFTHKLVLCEGLEDLAYINAWMLLSGRMTEMRRHGCHVVAVGGKSELLRPLLVAQAMGIPSFVLFDADGDKLDHENPNTANSRKAAHSGDNKALIAALSAKCATEFPTSIEWGGDHAIWPNDLEDSLSQDCGQDAWLAYAQTANNEIGNIKSAKKFSMHIGARLRAMKADNLAMPTLDKLCDSIIQHCEAN